MASQVSLIGIAGIPLVVPGDDLPALLVAALRRDGIVPVAGDAFVVTSKIVSKAEGCVVDLRTITPSPEAIELAARTDKEPELVELVLAESTSIVRAVPGVLLTRHRLGFTSANAAIDRSNADGSEHTALLMPLDPDASARTIRNGLDGSAARRRYRELLSPGGGLRWHGSPPHCCRVRRQHPLLVHVQESVLVNLVVCASTRRE